MQLLPILESEMIHVQDKDVIWFRRELYERVTCGKPYCLFSLELEPSHYIPMYTRPLSSDSLCGRHTLRSLWAGVVPPV